MSSGEWRQDVATMCGDAWQFGPHMVQKIIQGLEFLVATDQVSDFTVADVLYRVGVNGAEADSAASRIHAMVRGSGAWSG